MAEIGTGLESLATERLEAEITTLAGHIAAATCRWLLLIAEFDRRQAWGTWGCRSCAQWLAWQCALGLRAAHEHVRVAHALDALPAIRAAFAAGELSYSQVRALTRVAEPRVERELLDLARHATAAQLERLVRGYLSATALSEQARDSYGRRELVWWHDEDGTVVIHGRLPAEDGALVLEALERMADRLRAQRAETEDRDECSAEHSSPRTLRADALIELARGERVTDAEVVVNVDLERLAADAPGTCRLACGTVLAPETARRLACDQPVVAIHEKRSGPVGGGARTRFATARMNRLLDRRDGGCRFPGCAHARHLHTHHIVHWAHGGRTSQDNLIRLCSHHHRLVHEGGYRITGNANGRLAFHRPDGRRLPQHTALCGGRTSALLDLNRVRGADPGPGRITPAWRGEGLDTDWAVTVMATAAAPADPAVAPD